MYRNKNTKLLYVELLFCAQSTYNTRGLSSNPAILWNSDSYLDRVTFSVVYRVLTEKNSLVENFSLR